MNFTDNLKTAISIAQSLAKEHKNPQFSPAHLLRALLHKDIGLTEFLLSLNKDIFYIEEWAEVRIESCPKAANVPENPPGDENVRAVLREAENIGLKLSKENIDPVSVLAALSTPGVGFNYEQLKSLTLTQKEILDFLMEEKQMENVLKVTESDEGQKKPKSGQGALLKFCIDLNELAIQDKLDPVIARMKSGKSPKSSEEGINQMC